MKAAIISQGSLSSKWTEKAMRKYFEKVDSLNLKNIEVNLGVGKLDVLHNGHPIDEYDCVYAKGSFRYALLLGSIASAIYKDSYTPLKPESFNVGHDKLLTHLALQHFKIPMPKTYISATTEAAKIILKKVNYPIVMKFPQGTQGKGVMLADSFASASSMLDALAALRQPFIIQEYIDTGGQDIRAIVIGDKVVASMKRNAVQGESRANIHAGAAGEPCQLDSFAKKIAINTAKAIGADICAVDMLEGPSGPQVIEANVSPGLQGITKATGIDIADKIGRHLYKKTKAFKEKGGKEGTTELFAELGISSTKAASQKQQIITNLDFRGDRILLPKIVSGITKLSEKDEIVLKIEKGKIEIEKA